MDKALNYVFSKDRDFQEFLKTSLAGQVAPSLRIRKAAAADAPEPGERKTAGGVESIPAICVDRRRDPTTDSLAEAQRCYAPEEI